MIKNKIRPVFVDVEADTTYTLDLEKQDQTGGSHG